MSGQAKLMTPGGGGVILQPASSVASDVTLNVPSQNGTLTATDANGNLGLGVTPSAWGAYQKALQIGTFASFFDDENGAVSGVGCNMYQSGNTTFNYKFTGQYATKYIQAGNGQHQWFTAPSGTAGSAISFTQAMTLDASGNLLVGTTVIPSVSNTSGAYIYGSGQAQFFQSNAQALILNRLSSTGNIADFRQGSNTVGGISVTTTTTSYLTSSDYRLKENIQPMQNALATVSQLNPVTYTWKADGSDGQGFIAHELQAVVPDCVTGEKDAVDKDGKPVYQGIDTSFLVATLTAAIKELSAQTTALKASNDAIKAELDATKAKLTEVSGEVAALKGASV